MYDLQSKIQSAALVLFIWQDHAMTTTKTIIPVASDRLSSAGPTKLVIYILSVG